MNRPAVFLDRDGVLNAFAGPGQYVLRPEEMRLIPGAGRGLAALRRRGFAAIVVTNQSAIARGMITLQGMLELEVKLASLLRADGGVDGRWDGIYRCPHAPGDRCTCRKPRPGLLTRAAAEHGVLLDERSWIVGDSGTDIEAGRALGLRSALCLGPGTSGDVDAAAHADVVVCGLEEFSARLAEQADP